MKLSTRQQDRIRTFLLDIAHARYLHDGARPIRFCVENHYNLNQDCKSYCYIDIDNCNQTQKKYFTEMIEAHNILMRMRELMHAQERGYTPEWNIHTCGAECPCNSFEAAARWSQIGLWQAIDSFQEYIARRFKMDYSR